MPMFAQVFDMILKPLLRLFPSLILLILALWLREDIAGLDSVINRLLKSFPLVLLLVALLLSAYYNRAKIFSATLAMAFIYFLIQSQLQAPLKNPSALSVYTLLSLAVPFLIIMLNILPERGLKNRYGLAILMLLVLKIAAAFCIYHFIPGLMEALKQAMPVKPFDGYVLSLIASAVFWIAVATSVFYLYRYNSENAAVMLSVLVYNYLILVFFNKPDISIALFSAMGLNIIVYLIASTYNMAYRDELTGLKGRRAFNESLKGLAKRYTVAMLDIDRFKKLNDTYGHDVGDHVLKMVATQIGNVGGGGTVFRYGGEEFCIIFSGKTMDQCLSHLESLRTKIEEYRLSLRDLQKRPKSTKKGKHRRGGPKIQKSISVTVSIGVSERNECNSNPEAVIKSADDALYQAKSKGRNKVIST